MRHRELKPLFKTLLPSLPGFVGYKSLLLRAPIHGVLRAIDFDPSAFDKSSFYVATLVMPMCVPKDHLTLTFGHRVRQHGKYDGWSLTMPDLAAALLRDIQAYAVPYLAQADSFRAAVEVIRPFSGNPHAPKAMAFLLARTGDYAGATAMIDAYLPKLRMHSHWEKTFSTFRRACATSSRAIPRRRTGSCWPGRIIRSRSSGFRLSGSRTDLDAPARRVVRSDPPTRMASGWCGTGVSRQDDGGGNFRYLYLFA